MKTLSLIRHAESSWASSAQRDFERTLSPNGLREATRMAQWFRDQPRRPDLFLSSPALRALATAKIFGAHLDELDHKLTTDQRIYEADTAHLFSVVRKLGDHYRHVALFGHNPGVSLFSHALASCDFIDLPTCAVAQFEFTGDHWAKIHEHSGVLCAYQTPESLR